MAEQYTVTGTLSNKTTVILDQPVRLSTGRVRITVERLSNNPFWQETSIPELAETQGVNPIQTLDDLWGNFWPDDESIDEFITLIQQ